MSESVYPHPIIAREGWPFLAIAILIALALTWTGLWLLAAIAWLGVAFIAQFFRDPPRTVPEQANAVLAPADGKVMLVERTRDPYLDRDALKISVFMNVF
ncbi:MAG: phosphatidylserine decarboxylase family protein, partial [Betaproteobacteria bacterium]